MSRKTKAAEAYDQILQEYKLDHGGKRCPQGSPCRFCVVWAALNPKPKKHAKKLQSTMVCTCNAIRDDPRCRWSGHEAEK